MRKAFIDRKVIFWGLGITFIVLLSGCAATQVALEKKDLAVDTRMSDTIFLDADEMAQNDKTIFVNIKNTSGQDLDIESLVKQSLIDKGYKILPSAAQASYVLQANILYIGATDISAARSALAAGYGGAFTGALAGGMIGGAARNTWKGAGYGAAIGGLIGGAAETIAGALVKDVTYTIITDVMVSAKTAERVEQKTESTLKQAASSSAVQTSAASSSRKKYQTRIVSTANKVNLKLAEALPPLTSGLVKSVSGLF